jgi:hypothetical protein
MSGVRSGNEVAAAILESSGPAALPVGAWVEGGSLIRVGNAAVGSLRAANFGAVSSTNVAHGNTSPAAAGAQQYSGRLEAVAQGYKTDAPAGSVEVRAGWELRPVQGAAAPSAQVVVGTKVGAAAWVDRIILSTDGSLLWATDGGGSIGANGANRPDIIYAKTSVRASGAIFQNNCYAGAVRVSASVAASGEAGILAIGYGLGSPDSVAPTFANVPTGCTSQVWLTWNYNNKVTYIPGFQAP